MRIVITMLLVVMVTACTTNIRNVDNDLYLRADFTYWEARSEFKFKLNEENNIKYLKTKIKYDGNPYSFVIADKGWSENTNCGFKYGRDKVLVIADWIPIDCNYDFENQSVTPIQKPFTFNPKSSSEFLFELKLDGLSNPTHLRVTEIKKKRTNSVF